MKISKIIFGVFGNIIQLFISAVPIEKNIIIFGAWSGLRYADNAKYLFRFFRNENNGKRCIWITKSKRIKSEILEDGGEVYYYLSLQGIICQIRAAVVVYTHQVNGEFLSFLIRGKAKRVQLFHGIPLKKIDYDDTRNGNPRIIAKIKNILFPHLTDRCDLVIASSNYDAEIFKRAFNVPSGNVVITGYPRHDVLHTKNLPINNVLEKKRLLYLPTYRGSPGSEADPFAYDEVGFLNLMTLLDDIEGELYIKLHPAQKPSKSLLDKVTAQSNLKLYDEAKDLYEQLGGFDILITDFSSVYFDFVLTNKPVILAAFAKEAYLNNDRQLYLDVDEVSSMPVAYNMSQLIQSINTVVNGGYDWVTHEEIKKRFHTYDDQNSCFRVCNEVLRLLYE